MKRIVRCLDVLLNRFVEFQWVAVVMVSFEAGPNKVIISIPFVLGLDLDEILHQ